MRAFEALKEKGLSVALNPVLAVEMEDSPGGLHKVACLIKRRASQGSVPYKRAQN